MAVKEIVTQPNKVLDEPTKKVEEIDDEIKNVVKDLKDTLSSAKEPEGAGIAANQIGISKSICVIRNFLFEKDASGEDLFEEFVLINPKILKVSKKTDLEWEGCLSVPNIYGQVERPTRIKLQALLPSGDTVKMKAEGFFARVIQHEIDHLNGILFTSKVTGKTLTEEELDKVYSQ